MNLAKRILGIHTIHEPNLLVSKALYLTMFSTPPLSAEYPTCPQWGRRATLQEQGLDGYSQYPFTFSP